MAPHILTTVLALLVAPHARAFTTSKPFAVVGKTSSLLYMSEPGEKKIQITSGRKEIAYDSVAGRFFETNLEEEECIPEEEFCMIDDKTGKPIRLTVEEKERIFLDALQVCMMMYVIANVANAMYSRTTQSYYASGRKLLNDAEFDLLKEDLQWNGSDVAVLNRKEAKYLAAMQAYLKGTPMMTDGEFDALKKELKEDGSKFAVSTEPKCYIDTGICTVTLQKDNFRNNLLYLPATVILFLAWLAGSFELIEPIIRVNPLILTLLGVVPVAYGARAITDGLLFPGNFIAYGPCPQCEVNNRVYFGDILGEEGFKDLAVCKCPSCKTEFTVQRKSLRASTVPKSA